jgi:peptide-methionine (S)-S-oxide reductase
MSRILALFLFLLTGAFTMPAHAVPASEETLVVAGGCFWGIEAVFEHVKGVTNAVSGYAGGMAEEANYDAVSSGHTGHAEVVKITYDPAQISMERLLDIFFTVAHDPTQLNRQGPDHGMQYRSAIFTNTPEQKQGVETYIRQLQESTEIKGKIVTQVTALEGFYPAEKYHQNFAERNPNQPYIVAHDKPKVVKLKQFFPELYTERVIKD